MCHTSTCFTSIVIPASIRTESGLALPSYTHIPRFPKSLPSVSRLPHNLAYYMHELLRYTSMQLSNLLDGPFQMSPGDRFGQ